MHDSPYLAIHTHESTDNSVMKKLSLCVRILTPDYTPSTHIVAVANIDIPDGKGETIAENIKEFFVLCRHFFGESGWISVA